MSYILLDGLGKRVKVNGELSPVFEYPQQARKYIAKILGNSPIVKIWKVK